MADILWGCLGIAAGVLVLLLPAALVFGSDAYDAWRYRRICQKYPNRWLR